MKHPLLFNLFVQINKNLQFSCSGSHIRLLCPSCLLQKYNYYQIKACLFVLACTNQGDRQLSPCYSHPCILKSFFVFFNSLSGFRTVLFLCVTVSCNLTFSYQVFFMSKVKRFSTKCYNWHLSRCFLISLLQSDFALSRCCPGNARSK